MQHSLRSVCICVYTCACMHIMRWQKETLAHFFAVAYLWEWAYFANKLYYFLGITAVVVCFLFLQLCFTKVQFKILHDAVSKSNFDSLYSNVSIAKLCLTASDAFSWSTQARSMEDPSSAQFNRGKNFLQTDVHTQKFIGPHNSAKPSIPRFLLSSAVLLQNLRSTAHVQCKWLLINLRY